MPLGPTASDRMGTDMLGSRWPKLSSPGLKLENVPRIIKPGMERGKPLTYPVPIASPEILPVLAAGAKGRRSMILLIQAQAKIPQTGYFLGKVHFLIIEP